MDDRTFDEQAALAWISRIENDKAQVRDKDIYPRLQAWIKQTSPTRVLDIGAGQGVCAAKLELTDGHYTGIDPSPFLIARAKQLYAKDRRHFLLGNAYSLPFADGAFDAAFSVALWHLLEDLPRAAAELSRVLHASGHFLIIMANPDAYPLWTEVYDTHKQDGQRFEGKMTGEDAPDVLYLRPLQDIRRELQAAGLTVQRTESFRPDMHGRDFLLMIQGQKADFAVP